MLQFDRFVTLTVFKFYLEPNKESGLRTGMEAGRTRGEGLLVNFVVRLDMVPY